MDLVSSVAAAETAYDKLPDEGVSFSEFKGFLKSTVGVANSILAVSTLGEAEKITTVSVAKNIVENVAEDVGVGENCSSEDVYGVSALLFGSAEA
jgi:hypothetical protein